MSNSTRNKQILTIGLSDAQNGIIQRYATRNQTTLSSCRATTDALLALRKETICLIILNAVKMDANEAKEIVTRIRSYTFAPLIVLSRHENAQIIYERGADACVPDTIDVRSLLTISIAQIRRNEQFSQYDRSELGRPPLYRGDLIIDPMRHIVMQGGKEIRLLRREFRLLEFFARNPGVVLSADKINSIVWSFDHNSNRDISKIVSELRRKLSDSREKHTYIETIHGVGYRFIPYK